MAKTNNDLLLAILAMDAYNQGYGRGVKHGQTRIGTATLQGPSSGVPQGSLDAWQTAGFYAAAYSTPSGTVISFRGTDNPGLLSSGGSDIWNGWQAGLGYPAGSQAGLAMQFYKSVTRLSTITQSSSTTELVGHSLGGGLAGLLSSVSGTHATIFDTMMFQTAADKLAGLLSSPVHQNFRAEHVTGEILASFRDIPEFRADGSRLPLYQSRAIDSFGGVRAPWDLHSMALLVMLKYAEQTRHTEWHTVGNALWDAVFSDEVAQAGGAKGIESETNAAASSKLMSAIAYSALEEGNVFGDTAIRALFDDADELGRFVNDPDASSQFVSGSDYLEDVIAKLIVQFAGGLASGKILASQRAAAVNGVLKLDDKALAIDFSDETWFKKEIWSDAKGTGSTSLVKPEDLLEKHNTALNQPSADLEALKGLYTATGKRVEIDRVVLTVSAAGSTFTAEDRKQTSTKFTAIAGGDGPDHLTGSKDNDVILGNGGDDTISGGDGDNLISGGSGDDQLTGGSKTDIIFGGLGRDLIDGGGGNDKLYANKEDMTGESSVNNTLRGGAGNDTMFGAARNDALDGGADHDVLVAGRDRDTLTGGAGNDTLAGGLGDDVMDGGAGNDVYIVTSAGDQISDSGGVDWVGSYASYTLGQGLENLQLLNPDEYSGTATPAVEGRGNDAANAIYGNTSRNVLTGLGGDDLIRGGRGLRKASNAPRRIAVFTPEKAAA